MPDRLTMPRPKSVNCSARLHGRTHLASPGDITEPAWSATTRGALNASPRMKATVRLLVRKLATTPMAIMAMPTNQ